MRNNKPVNRGNADEIVERHIPAIKLPMIKCEAIFDFYSEEPSSISIQLEPESFKHKYEQILRIRRWNFKGKSIAWCIYSAERENLNDIVVRNIIWNRDEDVIYAKNNNENRRQEVVNGWPSINVFQAFIPSTQAKDIIKMLDSLDSSIKKGIVLEFNMKPEWEWRDLELKRLYDWGQVHNTWSTNMKNGEVENKIDKLMHILETSMERDYQKISTIYLNYSILPEEYQRII